MTAHDTSYVGEDDNMRIEPEISGVNVVLLGDFNPAIFTPAWFALHGLLPKHVAESAELRVANQQVTEFAAEWMRLQVAAGHFFVETLQAPHVRLCDFVARTFKEYLHHTPVRAFGINRDVHFRVKSLAERDRIGRTLAPVEPWGAWGQDLGLDGRQGGMTSLTMTRLNPEGRPKWRADQRHGGAIPPDWRGAYRSLCQGQRSLYHRQCRVGNCRAFDGAFRGQLRELS